MSIAEKLQTVAENEQKVYEAGKQTEYDRFWDAYQNCGNRTNYDLAFGGSGWTELNFNPKYDIAGMESCEVLFRGNKMTVDLSELFSKKGIKFDTSHSKNITQMFNNSSFIRIPEVNAALVSTLNFLFTSCKAETIDKLILKDDGSQTFTNTFLSCVNLANIQIEGVIGKSISFVDSSLLTVESVQSIIDALMTITDGVARTVTLHAKVKAKLTDEQITTITTTKGWTLA